MRKIRTSQVGAVKTAMCLLVIVVMCKVSWLFASITYSCFIIVLPFMFDDFNRYIYLKRFHAHHCDNLMIGNTKRP